MINKIGINTLCDVHEPHLLSFQPNFTAQMEELYNNTMFYFSIVLFAVSWIIISIIIINYKKVEISNKCINCGNNSNNVSEEANINFGEISYHLYEDFLCLWMELCYRIPWPMLQAVCIFVMCMIYILKAMIIFYLNVDLPYNLTSNRGLSISQLLNLTPEPAPGQGQGSNNPPPQGGGSVETSSVSSEESRYRRSNNPSPQPEFRIVQGSRPGFKMLSWLTQNDDGSTEIVRSKGNPPHSKPHILVEGANVDTEFSARTEPRTFFIIRSITVDNPEDRISTANKMAHVFELLNDYGRKFVNKSVFTQPQVQEILSEVSDSTYTINTGSSITTRLRELKP